VKGDIKYLFALMDDETRYLIAQDVGDKNRESVIVNPGFTVAPGFDPVIARSSKYTFNDYGMTWDNSSKNGFYSRFTYAP
jgi:hypothetical protein